MLLMLMNLM